LSTVDQAIVEAIIKRFSDLRNRGFDAFESEEAVKQGIILPTLQALGWNVFNTDEVSPEYSSGKGRVDYALLLKSNPAVFIEAKRVGASLSDDHQEQLLSYAFHEGVKLALLTNGITWEFYLPLTSGVWSGRKVYSIDLEQQDIQEASLIITNLLAKATVRTGEAERYAKELHRSRQRKEKISEAMPEAWKRLIEEPNELLIELIAEETEAVCGFKPDASTVTAYIREMIEQRVASQAIRPTRKPTKPRKYTASKLSSIDPKGRKPSSVVIFGKAVEVVSWRDVLVTVAHAMVKEHPREYKKILLSIHGRTREAPYFTHNRDELIMPKLIPDTSIYVEGNMSARSVVRMCQRLLDEFGHKLTDLRITY